MKPSFNGLKVVSLESRRAADMAQLIEKHEGVAISAPSMREVPRDDAAMLALAQPLLENAVDMLILLTGVGTRLMAEAIDNAHGQGCFLGAIEDVTVVARGPKPVAALRALGTSANITVPEPNTWRDVLETLDRESPVEGKRVMVQEYGMPNPMLIEGLQQRGAAVTSVPVYAWDLPQDLGPLRSAIDQIIAGSVDVLLLTSATQVHHLFKVAEQSGKNGALRSALATVCIGSIGPIASEAVEACGSHVDYEPDSPHMTSLVRELARRGAYLLEKKRVAHMNGVDTQRWQRVDMDWSGYDKTIADSVFMKACRREAVPHTPVWLMRQAGRYQREYHNLRKNMQFLELCKSSQTAAEVTLMAIDRLGADAAIIFADILLVVETLGFNLHYAKGEGPVIDNPVTGRADVPTRDGDAAELGYVYEAVRMTRKALRPDLALIGFAGAPFTVASYIIEGGKSSNYAKTKGMMFRDPKAWHMLMDKLVAVTIDYLNGQIEAGADAVQLFDSWAGALSPDAYRAFVLPHVQAIIAGVKAGEPGGPGEPGVPVINFATGNPALVPLLKEGGGDIVGLDWRCDLGETWDALGDDVGVMGNIDPTVLYATPTVMRAEVQKVLDKARGRAGHIFNLGHGISPDMSPENAAELIDIVHELSARV